MRATAGHLLGGRLRYAQPADGYRTGIEPVLLAASVPARPGQRVLEGGTGAGAGLMCLAARVPGIAGVGIELDPEMAALARRNIADNALPGLQVITGDVLELPVGGFDHAFANPPWHDPGSTPSPLQRRRLAKQGAGLEAWIAALARALRPGGTLALILPAHQADRAEAAWRRTGLDGPGVVALRPKAGRAAKLALLCSGGSREIVLHERDGAYTAEIEAVLRAGAAL